MLSLVNAFMFIICTWILYKFVDFNISNRSYEYKSFVLWFCSLVWFKTIVVLGFCGDLFIRWLERMNFWVDCIHSCGELNMFNASMAWIFTMKIYIGAEDFVAVNKWWLICKCSNSHCFSLSGLGSTKVGWWWLRTPSVRGNISMRLQLEHHDF